MSNSHVNPDPHGTSGNRSLDPAGQVSALFLALEAQIREIASRRLRDFPQVGLQTTELVNSAWLTLREQRNLVQADHDYFIRAAAETIKRVLIDHYRHQFSQKNHPGSPFLPLDSLELPGVTPAMDYQSLSEALDRLKAVRPIAYDVVVLRHFAGRTIEETARIVDLSPRSVSNEWATAIKWLKRELGKHEAD